jgi:hypothetical protein
VNGTVSVGSNGCANSLPPYKTVCCLLLEDLERLDNSKDSKVSLSYRLIGRMMRYGASFEELMVRLYAPMPAPSITS